MCLLFVLESDIDKLNSCKNLDGFPDLAVLSQSFFKATLRSGIGLARGK